jgi:hypothetical protein
LSILGSRVKKLRHTIAANTVCGRGRTPTPSSRRSRAVSELRLFFPPTAIGKDYLGETRFAASAASGTGVLVSLWGLLGLVVAAEEGIEFNVAGLTFGVDPLGLGSKLPGIGRIGPGEDPARKP